ncbi:hypothetical protein HYC85_012232 [Camellia sinensis]|uniref:Uncharacterized protein n=1 Tax=Camellia sinensis TaxID=4442 RepID=A0A7J7HBZ7_CAMSI|nr:hypothetical protein HYC85_012232 [Camellia sinensis]
MASYNVIYGPISDLFIAAKQRKILVEEDSSYTDKSSEFNSFVSHVDGPRWTFCEEPGVSSRGNMLKSIPASSLLRKLRWSTLGLQFDWSKFCEIHPSVISEVTFLHVCTMELQCISSTQQDPRCSLPIG